MLHTVMDAISSQENVGHATAKMRHSGKIQSNVKRIRKATWNQNS